MREIPVGPSRGPHRGRLRFALLAGAVAVAALAGYAGYVAYPRFGLPASVGVGLLALAAGAGVASFFSPCAFPLLLTLLSRQVRGRPAAAVGFAATFSVGAVAFLLALGVLIAAGGAGIAASITFTSGPGIAIRVVVGLALVLLGLIQAEVLPLSFHAAERLTRPFFEAQARLRRRHPAAGAALFGFGYLGIGFG
ncbi:MAG: cytochrome c biogenesis protein CcdA [Actinomycetota bacterium]